MHWIHAVAVVAKTRSTIFRIRFLCEHGARLSSHRSTKATSMRHGQMYEVRIAIVSTSFTGCEASLLFHFIIYSFPFLHSLRVCSVDTDTDRN